MYIGKHREIRDEPVSVEEVAPVSIPENYRGSAFSKTPPEETPTAAAAVECATEESCTAKALPVALGAGAHKESATPFRFDKLFSSDALLILLAILLSGSEDGGELAVILLLLLLF